VRMPQVGYDRKSVPWENWVGGIQGIKIKKGKNGRTGNSNRYIFFFTTPP